ncbi:MAG: ABC-type transport auxiliary lipoprotein family protein [Gammaproteobacteria bacterium]
MKRSYWALRRGFFCLLWAAICACQSGPAPRETYYQLAPRVPQEALHPKSCGTILVGRFATQGFAGGRPIVFREREDSLEIQRYHYHLWSETPAAMFQNAILRSLRATGLARYVVTPAERAAADWIVSGNILRIEHYPNSTPARVEIEAEFGIIAANTRHILSMKRYLETEPAASRRVEDAVSAFNTALERIVARFQMDARRVLLKNQSSCQ